MNALPQFLAQIGPTLVLGATALLSVGAAAIALTESPLHRQRTGELTMLTLLSWLVLACVPLPRLDTAAILRRVGSAHHWISDGWHGRLARVRPANPELARTSRKPYPETQAPTPTSWLNRRENLGKASVAASSDTEILPAPFSSVMSTGETPVPPGVGETNTTESGGAGILPVPSGSKIAIRTLQALTGRSTGDTPVLPVQPSARLASLVAFAFIIGAAGCVVWLTIGRLLLAFLTWTSTPPEPWMAGEFESLRSAIKAGRVRLRVSRRCRRAVSFGVLRPTIVLPARIARPEHREQLRHVLLHELAHVRQRDAVSLALFNLAMPLVYWNPVYWWIRSRTGLASELIADDWAAAQSDKQEYVRELIELIKATKGARFPRLAGVGMFQSPTPFYRRMKMLIERDKPLAQQCTRTARVAFAATFVLGLAIFTGLAGVQSARAQAPAEEPEASFSSDEATDKPDDPASSDELTEKPAAGEAPEERTDHPVARLQKALLNAQVTITLLEKQRDALRQELEELQKSVARLRTESKAKEQLQRLNATVAEQVRAKREHVRSEAAKQQAQLEQQLRQREADAFAKQMARKGFAENDAVEVPGSATPKAHAGLFDSAHAELDVVHLAIAYADAVEARALAERKLQGLKSLFENHAVPEENYRAEVIRYESSERKVGMLRSIAKVARDAAVQEMELLGQMLNAAKSDYQAGKVGHTDLMSLTIRQAQARQRVEILITILEGSDATTQADGSKPTDKSAE